MTGARALKNHSDMERHGAAADLPFGPVVRTTEPARPRAVVVCEHASNRLPGDLRGLGLPPELLSSHIAWDPGALGVARALAARLSATLVEGALSRLVYDCNRPPEAPDAIPAVSEIHAIPGNRDLPQAQRALRAAAIHDVFHRAVAEAAERAAAPFLVTVHSFTPVWRGRPRSVELGLLHGDDPRLARAMIADPPADLPYLVRLNEPYGQADGVTHTIDRHGAAAGRASVMIELRNDLLATPEAQAEAAARLAPWIDTAMSRLKEAA